ncbi:fatty acid CoA ligase family protein [Desulfogranum mediterraneum]|uniref:fatty acid CoA ligase family protein n=1 Tax=Desulfogranum mediterraneum TaxID=160661 RepID=UPI000421717D|nr:fatty acid CoA ligase family protein [Desulfogranum mediterraneum]
MTDYNIGNVLAAVAAERGDKLGLKARTDRGWQSWSFSELSQISQGLVARLSELGVRRGDRVMLMVRPSMEFICLSFGLFQLGAVVILIDPGMGYANLLRCIGSVRPDILIGIPKAILFSRLFRRPFGSLRLRISLGRSWSWRGPWLEVSPEILRGQADLPPYKAAQEDLAAIIFTTGSTGPPKGVQYTHGIFHAQLALIRDYFGIAPGDIDQPGFPLFGLFSIALGASAVIPDMDPTRPARVDPGKFIDSILESGVSYSFGSPAIWNVVSRYCLEQNITLPVRKILMAGAPVSGELIARLQQVIPREGEIYTPYGATESLPIAAIEGREVVAETWAQTCLGKGTCVGRELPGISIRIIAPVDGSLASWDQVSELDPGEIGEIVVRGPVVTRAYDHNDEETRAAKIRDGADHWHRMGDMGYLDAQGRLWFCGRKAHRVFTRQGVLYTIPCEAIFNQHPLVYRSALVGVGEDSGQTPVLIVEPRSKVRDQEQLFAELLQLARANPLTCEIRTFLLHRSFPVDIRHNAKIFREKLAVWARRRLQRSGC